MAESELTRRNSTPRAAALGFVGQDGKGAAAHEIEATDVDDEWARPGGDRGRLADQSAPDVFVGGIDLAAREDYHGWPAALNRRAQGAAGVAQLREQRGTERHGRQI